ncbi:hypothetical protein [Methylobacterium persicinum]|uniref:Uncharacterized protein n=1 Tax=Methylobacterium persicinum TaxID=374426 RepID=A0ABU0HHN3_9HYPH|nr:hypothetical protein [Methylobacterium persicinum]MDQ0441827.1 hypothetical protein [Methylobacterium persicinum]GJE38010.1 hypothetical protein KHHGKMAE_2076 [Methylobacterium persicinum]
MFARIWEAIKATLAVAALIAAALISADKLDHEKGGPPRGAALIDPVVTGAILPPSR